MNSFTVFSRVTHAIDRLRQRTLTVVSAVDPLYKNAIVCDNVSFLLSNFHQAATVPLHPLSSSCCASNQVDGATTTVKGHRFLTLAAAKKIVGLIRFINSFGVHQQNNSFVQRYPASFTSTSGEDEDDNDCVAVLALATSKLARRSRATIAGISEKTFFSILSKLHQGRASEEPLESFLSLDLLCVPWDLHYGRVWCRRQELSSLFRVVSFKDVDMVTWHKVLVATIVL